MPKLDLVNKVAWEKFDRGDHLDNDELHALIKSVRAGIAFLEARGETGGVLFKARLNLNDLEGYQRAAR